MDECENLVIDLEAYEGLEKQQQINDNDLEIVNITGLLNNNDKVALGLELEDFEDTSNHNDAVGQPQQEDAEEEEDGGEGEGEGEGLEGVTHYLEDKEIDDNEQEYFDTEDFENMGQTESKKSSKKCNLNEIETKGTAMSFGFRKKLNSTPKKFKKLLEHDLKPNKKQDKCNNPVEEAQADDTKDLIGTVITTEMKKDSNGNAEIVPKIHFEKVGAAAAAATLATTTTNSMTTTLAMSGKGKADMAPLKPALKNSSSSSNSNQGVSNYDNLPGAYNRFGYRGSNIPRPASAGISSSTSSRQANDVCESMITSSDGSTATPPKGVLVSNLKRRSKSAHAGRALASQENDKASDGNNGTPKINPTQTKTLTFNLNQNTTIEYQRRQFFEQVTTATPATVTSTTFSSGPYGRSEHPPIAINTGLHTNVIVRPTPRPAAATYAKFTLQTVSLPKPEFPVAISLSATTPTTPNSTFSPPSIVSSGAKAKDKDRDIQVSHSRFQNNPLTAIATQTHHHFDTKNAKQMANNSTRRGFSGSREISADSGIASMDMALEISSSSSSGRSSARRQASPKRGRSRPRHLQMVMNGRHKFEVRDVDDPLSSESNSFVETLALPKLPADNQTIPLPLCGLVRSNTVLSRENYESQYSKANEKQTVDMTLCKAKELERTTSEESESIEEEKLFLDCSTTEKNSKTKQYRDINTCSSKTSSPGSSIMSSWCNAGESLAAKDCSSASISSSEDSNKLEKASASAELEKNKLVDDLNMELNDDDISLINTDLQISTISSFTDAQNLPQMLNETATFHDNKLVDERENEQEKEKEKQNQGFNFDQDRDDVDLEMKFERPKHLYNALNEAKFAEMALAGSQFLLEDETSPTDSLVSSTDSEEAGCKLKKHKINEELQEKDIDEISPELEPGSPISPGTPTHASHSLSLSECGNLIDDEIADQPALLFNDAQESGESHKELKTDTPTLMETLSIHSLKNNSKTRSVLQQAIELSLRTPLAVRKAVMERAESLDTLSPCESICSDDLMMDFETQTHSSIDSIDRSVSIKSRSGSDLNNMNGSLLFSEMDRKGSDVMKELNSLLKVRLDRKAEKESVMSQLPARATRLLNRSRLQQQCSLAAIDPEQSPKQIKTARRHQSATAGGSRNSTASTSTNASPHQSQFSQQRFNNQHPHQPHHHNQLQSQRLQHREVHSSSDDLMLYDKSFRNAMIQDVLQFKKQLLRLRRILQETATVDPFDSDNGQLFASCGLDSKQLEDLDLDSLTSSLTDDPMQELMDLRRQVVYLQSQVDERDRTIRLQKNLIEKLEAEKVATMPQGKEGETPKECVNIATQTERTRPHPMGIESLSRSKPEFTSYTTHFPAILANDTTTIIRHQHQYPGNTTTNNVRRHTVISATLTNYNNSNSNSNSNSSNNINGTSSFNQMLTNGQGKQTKSVNGLIPLTNGNTSRRASIAWETQTNHQKSKLQQEEVKPSPKPLINGSLNSIGPAAEMPVYKPVRITLIGDPMQSFNPKATNGFASSTLITNNNSRNPLPTIQTSSSTTSTTTSTTTTTSKSQSACNGSSANDLLQSSANSLKSISKICNGNSKGISRSSEFGSTPESPSKGFANGHTSSNGHGLETPNPVYTNGNNYKGQNGYAKVRFNAQKAEQQNPLAEFEIKTLTSNGRDLKANSHSQPNYANHHPHHHEAFDQTYMNMKNEKSNGATVTIV